MAKGIKKRRWIRLETLHNGYALTFDGMTNPLGYMYHSEQKMMEGMMVHIGLGVNEQLNMDKMKDFIEAAINWKDNEKCVKEIRRLNQLVEELRGNYRKTAILALRERQRFIALYDSVEVIKNRLRKHEDRQLRKSVENLLKTTQRPVPLTFKKLGITSDSIIDNENDDEL